MARVKRGGKGVRRAAAARGRAATARAARGRASSVLDFLMRFLPFTEEQLHRIFLVLILAGAAALAWFIASLAGLPGLVHAQTARIAGDAGFEVNRVAVTGVERMNEMRVYEKALSQRDRPMPAVDVHAVRDELLNLAWVKDARVSRQLPDTLRIDIVEREPHAVFEEDEALTLVDKDGVMLEPAGPRTQDGYLHISGPGARRQIAALDRLLDAAPALRPHIARAEWVGNRRWNLHFDTGQVLVLPEGDDAGAGALISFARLDGMNRLLGGKVASFDMRSPDKLYMRVPGRAEQAALASEER